MTCNSVVIRLLATITLIAFCTCDIPASQVWGTPRRCCSPDQWEADVRNFGTTGRIRDPQMKITAKFVYDHKNQRWAFDYKDLSNRRSNLRVVFDHQKDNKFVVTSKGCFSAHLNAPSMDQYCVPVNASHHGFYDYGLNREMVGYDVWSYDMMYTPVRHIIRTSRDGCLPLQEAAVSLVRNRFRWSEGEPSCVPWQFPEKAADGDCFRSHVNHTVDRHGTVATAPIFNMDFRNINVTITDETIFKFPHDCKTVDELPDHIQHRRFWGFLIMRMKKD